jgi:hypothetical protein
MFHALRTPVTAVTLIALPFPSISPNAETDPDMCMAQLDARSRYSPHGMGFTGLDRR